LGFSLSISFCVVCVLCCCGCVCNTSCCGRLCFAGASSSCSPSCLLLFHYHPYLAACHTSMEVCICKILSLSLARPLLLSFFSLFCPFFGGVENLALILLSKWREGDFLLSLAVQKKKVRNWTFAVYISQMSLWSIPSSNACFFFFFCGGITTTPLFFFFFFPRGQLSFFSFLRTLFICLLVLLQNDHVFCKQQILNYQEHP
jgi:hypothetical protein